MRKITRPNFHVKASKLLKWLLMCTFCHDDINMHGDVCTPVLLRSVMLYSLWIFESQLDLMTVLSFMVRSYGYRDQCLNKTLASSVQATTNSSAYLWWITVRLTEVDWFYLKLLIQRKKKAVYVDPIRICIINLSLTNIWNIYKTSIFLSACAVRVKNLHPYPLMCNKFVTRGCCVSNNPDAASSLHLRNLHNSCLKKH